VALVPQWRQDHPNNRPPVRAAVDSEMGHEPPLALQKKIVRAPIGRASRTASTRYPQARACRRAGTLSLAPTAPALPTGSCGARSVWPPEHGPSGGPGAIASVRQILGLMPQRRRKIWPAVRSVAFGNQGGMGAAPADRSASWA
jgi:hypothetical protein